MQADFVRFPNYQTFSEVYIDINPSKEQTPPEECNICYDSLGSSREKDQIEIEVIDDTNGEFQKVHGEPERAAEKEHHELFAELPAGIYSHPNGYHPLHSPCLKRWAAFRDTCPSCRQIIPQKTLSRLRRIDDRPGFNINMAVVHTDINNITWIFIAMFCGAMTAYMLTKNGHQSTSMMVEGAGVGLLCTVATSNLLDTRIRDAAISVIGGMVPIVIDQLIITASDTTRLAIFTFTSFAMLNVTGVAAGISAIIGLPSSILGMGGVIIGQLLGFNDSHG